MKSKRKRELMAAALLAALALVCPSARATVTRKDVVLMKNGDRLTGNIKRLQNGVLYIETEYFSGSTGLDWRLVEKVESTAQFQIVLKNGGRLIGQIEKLPQQTEADNDFVIREAGRELRIPSSDIVDIGPQKENFWRQLAGSIDAGSSYTSGNSQTTVDVSTNAKYVTKEWEAGASFDSTFNGQSGASKTNREDGQLSYARFLNRNSFLMGLADFLHSSEQSLNLRTTLGAGYGRYLIRSGGTDLRWVAGGAYTNESFNTTASPSENNTEALLGLQYDQYRFNFGELHSQLFVFPGLSDSGRVRVTTNNSLLISLTNNFHFTVSLWDNYDSRPPNTAKKNELGISAGVGWKF